MTKPPLNILLAAPRGFCAGVDRAIQIVEKTLQKYGAPVYVRHEIVHNKFVVESLRAKGAVFVEELDEIPDDGAPVVFSAHGVPKSVSEKAQKRKMFYIDATCPLVSKVHKEAEKHFNEKRQIVLIGHAGHPEVEGTMGQYDTQYGGKIYLVENEDDVAKLQVSKPNELAFVTQTTLSVDDTARVIDALRAKFPAIQGPRKDDICYATQNRQDAVKTLAQSCEVVLVVGSPNSSNSNRLRELAERIGAKAYLIDNESQLQQAWFAGVTRIGLTAGASAPEVLIQQVVTRLREWGGNLPQELDGRPENVVFSMPKELRIPTTTV